MVGGDRTAIERAEERLRAAMQAGAVDELEALLGEECVFTSQAGVRMSRADDLSAHRSGLLRIAALDAVDGPTVRVLGDSAVVWLTIDLVGRYGEATFAGRFAYTRVWQRQEDAWRVVAAHCSEVIDRATPADVEADA